jgi:hypothetical protein
MAIVPLPLPPGAEARALLHHILEHADIVGTDTVGRTFILLAVEGRVLERLMTFDADAAELEPESDDEEDGPPLPLDLVPRKLVSRRRVIPFGKSTETDGTQGDDPAQGCTARSRRASRWTTRTSTA